MEDGFGEAFGTWQKRLRASSLLHLLQVGSESTLLQHSEGDLPLQQQQPAAQHRGHGHIRLPNR